MQAKILARGQKVHGFHPDGRITKAFVQNEKRPAVRPGVVFEEVS